MSTCVSLCLRVCIKSWRIFLNHPEYSVYINTVLPTQVPCGPSPKVVLCWEGAMQAAKWKWKALDYNKQQEKNFPLFALPPSPPRPPKVVQCWDLWVSLYIFYLPFFPAFTCTMPCRRRGRLVFHCFINRRSTTLNIHIAWTGVIHAKTYNSTWFLKNIGLRGQCSKTFLTLYLPKGT